MAKILQAKFVCTHEFLIQNYLKFHEIFDYNSVKFVVKIFYFILNKNHSLRRIETEINRNPR